MRDIGYLKYLRRRRDDAMAAAWDRRLAAARATIIPTPPSAVVDYQALRDANRAVDDDEEA
jgi:hypothetical protein